MKRVKGLSPDHLSRNYSGSSQFFTPPPLISCVLRGIEFILQTEFHLSAGLHDGNLAFLDPAAGALEFPLALLQSVQKSLSPVDVQIWVENVFYRKSAFFELDPQLFSSGMAALMKLVSTIIPQSSLMPRFFCGNTLSDRTLPPSASLSSSDIDLGQVRDEIPANPGDILVIFGNPPYAISSATKSDWITALIEDYKTQLNRPGEKRILGLKGIQDDYVKFLRFGQWKLCDQDHPGLLAFVINNYFLDGTIFRGLRASLIENFDAIWIINLHGDPKKRVKRSSPLAVKNFDENVFDIQTGICLFFGLHLTSQKSQHHARIYYAEMVGSKLEKFSFLDREFASIPFQPLHIGIDFEMIPGDRDLEEEYSQFPCLTDIFTQNIVGIQSLHDTLITHPDESTLKLHLSRFYSPTLNTNIIVDERGQRWIKNAEQVFHDARDWTINYGLQGSLTHALSHLVLWQWRGFDRWWVAYDEYLMTKGSSSYKLMQFLLPGQNNLAIVVSRVSRKAAGDSSVFITDKIAESHVIEGGSGIGDYIFPLRINSIVHKNRKTDWKHPLPADTSNISQDLKNRFPFLKDVSDDAIFYYCYAILFTPLYRQRYQPLLKKGFPRIPFFQNVAKIQRLSSLGHQLTDFHRLISPKIAIETWPRSDRTDLTIRNPIYDEDSQRIYFDHPNYSSELPFWIGEITPEMWAFEIGGMAQLSLWLKHRTYSATPKKFGFYRAISTDELCEFLRICCAIRLTLAILPKLDCEYLKN